VTEEFVSAVDEVNDHLPLKFLTKIGHILAAQIEYAAQPAVTPDICILQISDLHRDPKNPIRNGPLLDSLQNDLRHYTCESEYKIRKPEIIIVSGDVIQGVKTGQKDPDAKLREQYDEALGFLNKLTDTFLDGDRQRVVIIPGNHDSSACHSMQSMQRIEIIADRKKEFVGRLFSPNSGLRWSWSDLGLYEIVDESRYQERFRAFADFYHRFYDGTRSYDLTPSKQFDIFDFPDANLTIAAFSSCFNNDILNKQGTIHPECIAEVGTRFRNANLQGRLRMAVWHHNTEGLPMQSDYMDPDTIQNLIDCGFSLGFHGHQHRPQFLDTRFRYGGGRRITVISAGTLCGSASYRFGRAYNLIEISTRERVGRLHLREMQNDNFELPIWGIRNVQPTSSYLDFQFDPPPEPIIPHDEKTERLAKAQHLFEQREYEQAAEALRELAESDGLARRLFVECLHEMRAEAEIIARFDPPKGPTEAIYLMEALWATDARERLKGVLIDSVVADAVDPAVIEIRTKYKAKLGI
jgi:predicted MPP superfamily phosphohydrolase